MTASAVSKGCLTSLSNMGQRFDLSQSPLQFLIAGLRRTKKLQAAQETVIAVLVSGVAHRASVRRERPNKRMHLTGGALG